MDRSRGAVEAGGVGGVGMPLSLDVYNKDIKNHIHALSPKTVLDVGAGRGKYADLIHFHIDRNIVVDAVEPTANYASTYQLHEKYRNVYVEDIASFIKHNFKNNYDLCILGDVLEHLFLYEAMGVLDALAYKCKFLMVIWPTNLPQDYEFDNVYEMHRSNFTVADLTRFNIQCYKTTFLETLNTVPVCINYALLSGHTLSPENYMRRMDVDRDRRVTLGVINDV